MCQHSKIYIVPTIENSWGISDTFHIKCADCNQLLYENISSNQIETYIRLINPLNKDDLLHFL